MEEVNPQQMSTLTVLNGSAPSKQLLMKRNAQILSLQMAIHVTVTVV